MKKLRTLWLYVMPFFCVLCSCGGHDHAAHPHGHDHSGHVHPHPHSVPVESAQGGSNEIVLTSEQVRMFDIQTEVVNLADFQAVYKVSGALQASMAQEVVVSSATAGVVKLAGGGFTDGAVVRNGQVLARVSAHELAEGDPVKKAGIEYLAAQVELQRAEALAVDQLISLQELEAVRLRYATARAAYEGVASKTNAVGTAVSAPMSGYIKQLLVDNGSYVTVGQPLFVLTQSKRLLLRAEVPVSEASILNDVRSAHFRTDSDSRVHDLDSLNGRLISVGHTVAPRSFYLPVTFEFDNVGHFIPGSFAEIWLKGSVHKNVLSLPYEALTEEHGQYYVYVQLDAECYRKQAVTIGVGDGRRVEIRKGLKVGDKVVVQGATQVRLAGLSSAIPGHNHNH